MGTPEQDAAGKWRVAVETDLGTQFYKFAAKPTIKQCQDLVKVTAADLALQPARELQALDATVAQLQAKRPELAAKVDAQVQL